MARLWGTPRSIRRKRFFAAVLCLLMAGTTWAAWRIHAATDTTRVQPITLPAEIELHSGDIIVAGGVSLQSRFVRQMTDDNQYSHVGMIQVQPDGVYVIHAAPEGEGDGGVGGKVARIPLKVFLSERGYITVRVVRLCGDDATALGIARDATNYADACTRQEIPFDAKFDLLEHRAMYCSELVYLAYEQAGYRWPDTLIRNVSTLIVNGPAITPSAFAQCPDFQTVWEH